MNERSARLLAPLRLLCGVIMVLEGWQKFQGGWPHGSALLATLDSWVSAGSRTTFLPMVGQRAHPKIRHAGHHGRAGGGACRCWG
jgi:hypothetical protein